MFPPFLRKISSDSGQTIAPHRQFRRAWAEAVGGHAQAQPVSCLQTDTGFHTLVIYFLKTSVFIKPAIYRSQRILRCCPWANKRLPRSGLCTDLLMSTWGTETMCFYRVWYGKGGLMYWPPVPRELSPAKGKGLWNAKINVC